MRAQKTTAVLLALSLGVVAAACGDDDEDTTTTEAAGGSDTTAADGGSDTTAAAGGENVCPENLVIQTDWFPELEHGGTYQLIGPGGDADKDTISYSGPVQEQYKVGGLETITIKTISFDKANSSQLLDGDADMAYIGFGDVIKDSAAIDMVVVMKTLDKDPQMVMWDPTQYDIQEPADIAETGAKVLHFPGAAYIDYMIANGIMTEDQDDPSYDGSDAKWVAEAGAVIQQGFASNEVYKYENEIAWKDGAPADVSFFTVGEMGFDNYPASLTMLKSRADELDACLTLLIPKMAQAWVDFFNDPKPITDAMIEINVAHDGFWGLSPEINEAGLAVVEEKEIAANSADGTYCSIDADRAQGIYDTVKAVYDAQGVEITDDVTSIYTNKYCEGAPGR
ncbi:MAG: hypothetical protein KDB40_08685 [Acidimicrobiales bacterium]|nr:hypothetical protein [Acidimicrobiales bacterium]MCB9393949.1 hypothetical protein [Acidimicrobiaceae bacterium]